MVADTAAIRARQALQEYRILQEEVAAEETAPMAVQAAREELTAAFQAVAVEEALTPSEFHLVIPTYPAAEVEAMLQKHIRTVRRAPLNPARPSP